MWFIELYYTNGRTIRLPQPYKLRMEAYSAMLEFYPTSSHYTAYLVCD
jgi:hypothetical protein